MVASFFARSKLHPADSFAGHMRWSRHRLTGGQSSFNSEAGKLIKSIFDYDLDLGSFDTKNCSNI